MVATTLKTKDKDRNRIASHLGSGTPALPNASEPLIKLLAARNTDMTVETDRRSASREGGLSSCAVQWPNVQKQGESH